MHRIVLAVLSAPLLATACTSTRTEPTTSTEPRGAKSFIEGRWEALPSQAGVDHLVWSGRELLLYGYENPEATPSIRVFDPSTNGVRSIPVPGPDRTGASTTWTGHELLVIGGRPEAFNVALRDYAFAPSTSGWRELPPAPLSARRNAPIVWTGREAIVVSGRR